jgi:N-acetylglutamate synthase
MQGEDVWVIEEGFSLAWPALAEKPMDGWLLKVGGGVSRRSNSANPSVDCQPLAQILSTIELFYRQQHLPTLVRVLSVQAPSFEWALEQRGYCPEGEARTLRAQISNGDKASRTILEFAPSAKWVDDVTSAQQRTTAQKAAYEGHVAKITLPCAFASTLDDDGEAVSWAYGAIRGKSLFIESVVTRSDRRGHGHGRDVMRALLAWGDANGAITSVLQVQAENYAACRLYETLGFREELYRYRYWRAPANA